MLSFLAEYGATMVIGLVLLLIIAAIAVKLIKDKQKGKTACNCGCGSCGGCPSSSMCHGHKKQ